MSKNEGFELLCGTMDKGLRAAPPLPPLDDRVIAFLSDVSAALLADREARSYPDVITFAFFCRKAHLMQLRQEYASAASDRLGRGLIFHIAPSNVPINFAYSLVAALLAGNASIVKASSQDFAQTRIVCKAFQPLLEGAHEALAPYVNVITYSRDRQDLTERFSAHCDARVIWGGDETVRRVREAPLPAFAFDMTFADRYSLLCIQPGAVLAMDVSGLASMAQGFYNDTFLNDQNACTTPRLVYWLTNGDSASLAEAKERFWQAIHAYAAPRYEILPVVAVDKLTALYRAAVIFAPVQRISMQDNLIARIRVNELSEALLDFRCAGGCFVEYEAENLEALRAIATRKVQTISYLGLEADVLRSFVREHGLRGVDRIVPIGKTMDFSLTWDGYDFIRTLSRRIQAL